MTKDELVSLLVSNYKCKKSYLRTIPQIISEAEKVGLKVIKDKKNYEIEEIGAIKDFTKPLIIHREIPEMPKFKSYNGVPVKLFDAVVSTWLYLLPYLWMYFMNKEDGECIQISELKELFPELSQDAIIVRLDELMCAGYLKETDTNIEFFAEPIQNGIKSMPPYSENFYFGDGQLKRLTPVKIK